MFSLLLLLLITNHIAGMHLHFASMEPVCSPENAKNAREFIFGQPQYFCRLETEAERKAVQTEKSSEKSVETEVDICK